jgi:hypothetical protein
MIFFLERTDSQDSRQIALDVRLTYVYVLIRTRLSDCLQTLHISLLVISRSALGFLECNEQDCREVSTYVFLNDCMQNVTTRGVPEICVW